MSADKLYQDIVRTHEIAAALREYTAAATARRAEAAELAGACRAAGVRVDGMLAGLDEALAGVRGELAQTLEELLERLNRLRTDAAAENAKFVAARGAAHGAWEEAGAAVGDCDASCAAEEQDIHAALGVCTQQLSGHGEMLAGELRTHAQQWAQAVAGHAHDGEERAASVYRAVTATVYQDLGQHVTAPCEQAGLTLKQNFEAFHRGAQQTVDQTVSDVRDGLAAFGDAEAARAAAIMQQWSATKAAMEAVTGSIVTLGHGMLETVESVSSGIQTMNVGLRVTVGTFNNVRDVFEDIRNT